jgi:hypothetical protein
MACSTLVAINARPEYHCWGPAQDDFDEPVPMSEIIHAYLHRSPSGYRNIPFTRAPALAVCSLGKLDSDMVGPFRVSVKNREARC